MKLIILLTIISTLHASAGVLGQSHITLAKKDATLESIFNEIRKQSGFDFAYNSDWLEKAHRVTLDVKDLPLENVLDICFRDQPFTYSIQNKLIIVKQRLVPEQINTQNYAKATGPTIKAHGVVYNESGQPLAGANITEKKSGRGTITNAKGEFELTAVPANSVLIISFIGYAPQQLTIKDADKVQVYLKVAKNELDKVVIQAYGTTTQRLATGNIATVTAEQIERQPVMNVLAALQGQVPGVVVSMTNGYASAPFKVEIRGRSGLNPDLPSEPLYIIDGVPLTILDLGNNGGNYNTGSRGITQNGFPGPAGGQSPLFSINPGDIESITVLKDADATSIYGSRGANGVIIITTKSGKPGKTKSNIEVYQGVSEITNYYNLLNTQQYLQMRREAFKNDKVAMDQTNAYDLLTWDTTKFTNWQKVLWGGMGKTTDVDLSLSGGDKQTTFRIGGTYHRETDILAVSGSNQRTSIQFNLSHKSLDQRLNASFTSTYSYVNLDMITMPDVVTLPPDAPPIYDAKGNLNFSGWAPIQNGYPFANLLRPYTTNTGFLNSRLTLQYELFKGLSFKTSIGYSTYHNSQIQTTPIAAQNPQYNPFGSSNFGNNNGTNAIVEPQLEYKTLLGKGKFNVLLGGSEQKTTGDGNIIYATGYTNDHLLQSASGAPSTSASTGSGQYKYAAAFARVNYNWEDKYILNLSARRDGSSRFGLGKQFSNFGSVGVAWIFTKDEYFDHHFSFLSFGKLRGSYGTTGSDQIPNYQYLSQWVSYSIPYQGAASYTSILLPNPDLVWQSNHKLEGALDLGFFKDRLTFEVAWYRNRCGNQLVPFILPSITGFNSVTANFPALVENQGWEGTFKYKLIDKKDFVWSANISIGINRNRLISYPNLDQSPYASAYTVGKSLNISRLLHFAGLDPQTGQYTFQDKNHDGQITNYYNNGNNDLYDKDMSIKFDGGFNTDFRYKGLQLNLFFIFRKQQLRSAIYSGSNPGELSLGGNQSTQVLNHWQKAGDNAIFARYTTAGTSSDQYFSSSSDGVYSDGSYIRLRNLSLAYDIPTELIKKTGIQSFKIYFRGENLFVITKYNGLDPDTPGLGILPPAKIFTGGVQFNF